jgi:hypothetical protein
MYTAVAEANFKPGLLGGTNLEVTRVAIYAKNPYSFFDDTTDGGSQYLGHWNRDGICLVPEGFVAQKANWGNWSNYAPFNTSWMLGHALAHMTASKRLRKAVFIAPNPV